MNGTNLKKFQMHTIAEKRPRSWTLKIIFWLYLSQFLPDFDEIVPVSGNWDDYCAPRTILVFGQKYRKISEK